MNGLEFPIDGPMIEGTWQNMQTGDYFNVRDSFIQDGMLMIQATDGRMFDYNTIQNYVKVDKPVPMQKQKKTAPKKQIPTEILNEVEDAGDITESGLLPEDLELINGGGLAVDPGVLEVKPPVKKVAEVVMEDEDIRLIRRALDRAKKDPEVNVNIKWSAYPNKQMDMLVDVLGVDVDKIADYYINKIDLTTIREAIKEEITNIINRKLEGDCDTAVPGKEQKKTTKKKEA